MGTIDFAKIIEAKITNLDLTLLRKAKTEPKCLAILSTIGWSKLYKSGTTNKLVRLRKYKRCV